MSQEPDFKIPVTRFKENINAILNIYKGKRIAITRRGRVIGYLDILSNNKQKVDYKDIIELDI